MSPTFAPQAPKQLETTQACVPSDIMSALNSGPGQLVWSIGELAPQLESRAITRVLLVLDRGALAASGLSAELNHALSPIEVETFVDFEPNPRCESAANAARLASQFGAQAVVAVGGGSCCDVAKVAALAAQTPDLIESLSRGHQADAARPLPIFAVPTTSGTGSETTHFAAIYVDGRKVSVAHHHLLPTVAVLDERFHFAMPPVLAACSGLDALSQSIESLWASGATPDSSRLAHLGGQLIAEHLVSSVREASEHARRQVMIGAHLAGKAINISKTTAAHALSYQFTQCYGLQHGHAVALTLGHLAAANARVAAHNCAHPHGPHAARQAVEQASAMLGVTPDQMPARMTDLLRSLGLPATLHEAGVERSILPELASRVDPVRLGNNPRRLSVQELSQLLDDAYVQGCASA